MTSPDTRRVLDALAKGGADARFVGGCVRDAVLGRPVKDIDIATHAPPDEVMRILVENGIRTIPTGIAHGTVTAVVGESRFEITTLRRDVETFGRHARVEFTDDWRADAARRDLTMNAMFCAPDGTLYDPFGGLADLAAGRIRFVGDPPTRIAEDVLRILRFFRFHAHYGRIAPDPEALDACREAAGRLRTLSGERIRAELLRLLGAADPAPVMVMMRDLGILAVVLPEAGDLEDLKRLTQIEDALAPDTPADAIRRLAATLAGGRDAAQAVADRLRLSNRDRDRLTALLDPPMAVDPGAGPRERRRALHRLGSDPYTDLVLLTVARRRASPHADDFPALTAALSAARSWQPVALPVKGADLVAMGVRPGPEVGRLLAALETWWEENDYDPDRARCLAEAAARLQGVGNDGAASGR